MLKTYSGGLSPILSSPLIKSHFSSPASQCEAIVITDSIFCDVTSCLECHPPWGSPGALPCSGFFLSAQVFYLSGFAAVLHSASSISFVLCIFLYFLYLYPVFISLFYFSIGNIWWFYGILFLRSLKQDSGKQYKITLNKYKYLHTRIPT